MYVCKSICQSGRCRRDRAGCHVMVMGKSGNTNLQYLLLPIPVQGSLPQMHQSTYPPTVTTAGRNAFLRYMLEMLQDTDFYQTEELKKHIFEAIHALPPSYREAFVMHRFENKSYKEIAEILQVSTQTVNYRIQQALKQLRVSLKDYLPIIFLLLPKNLLS